MPVIIIENGKVHRLYTQNWDKIVDPNTVTPDRCRTLYRQRRYMMEYIAALHDKIDELITVMPKKP
jgi:hypothetical protein